MEKIYKIIFLVFICSRTIAQSPLIALKLNVKNNEMEVQDGFKVKILSNKDTVSLHTNNDGFYIPDSLCRKKKTVILNINNYEFIFDNIPLTWNSELPKWIVNVDFKPFLEENKWLIKNSDKKVKWFYSLANGTGSLLTVYRFKKFKPTK